MSAADLIKLSAHQTVARMLESDEFRKYHAARDTLTLTHYRHLLKVEDEQARQWYLEEAIKENWSTRALERQRTAMTASWRFPIKITFPPRCMTNSLRDP